MPRRRPVFPILLLLLFAFARAEAGEVPESALSRGSFVRPEFLDSEGQIYLYPQRAATFDAQLFGMNTGSSSSVSVGGIARAGRWGFFLLGQPNPGFPGSSHYFQGGLAAAGGAFRFGAALRGSYGTDDDFGSVDDSEVNHERYERTSGDYTKKSLEGAAGIGLETDRWTLDVSLERRTETLEASWSRVADQHNAPYYSHEESEYGVKTRVDPVWETACRVAVRVSENSEILAAGSYARPEYEVRGTARWDSLAITLDENERSHVWSGGLAVRFPTEYFERVTVFASMRDYETLEDYAGTTYSARRNRYRKAWVGVAVEREMMRNLTARAGIEARYERRTERRDYVREYEFRSDGNDAESFGEGFSWGASYRWRNVLLHGVVSANLDFWDIFSALDIHLFF